MRDPRFDDDDLDPHRPHRRNDTALWSSPRAFGRRDLGIAHKLARRIKAGTVWINTHNFGDPGPALWRLQTVGPGAAKWGFEAIELYTEVKAVAVAL